MLLAAPFALLLATANATGASKPDVASAACPRGDKPQGSLEQLADGEGRVALRVDDDGVGHLRWRLPFTNQSPRAASTQLALTGSEEQPIVVTGAHVVGDSAAALVEAGLAENAWGTFVHQLEQGVPEGEAKPGKQRFGIKVADADEGVVVDVAGACSVRALVVEVEALIEPLPTPSGHGGWRFAIPAGFARAELVVDAGDRAVFVDGQRSKRATGVFGLDDVRSFDVEVATGLAAGMSGVSVRGAVTALQPVAAPRGVDDETAAAADAAADGAADAGAPAQSAPFAIVHAAIDLPARLSVVPPELRVVFVVDASVSAGDAGVAMALGVVKAFLDEAPDDVGWALVTASRTPHLLVPPWRTRTERHLPTIEVHNGSDIAAAVELARKIAADALPGSGRVVVLSDLQQSERHEARLPVLLAPQGAHGPLLHTLRLPADVVGGARGAGFARVFAADDVLAFSVERTGGVLLDVHEDDDADARVLGAHLVRPTRIDAPIVLIDGHDPQMRGDDGPVRAERLRVWDAIDAVGEDDGPTDELPAALGEGGGLRASWKLDAVRAARFEGFLWGARVEVPLASSPAQRALSLGITVNDALASAFDDDEVRAAAVAGHFVSRVTSFIDVPTWAPAEVGLGIGSSACGCGGCGCCGSGIGIGGSRCGVGPARVLQTQEILDQIAAEAAEACQVKEVSFRVEFGDDELLDVVTAQGGRCVDDFVWRQRLDVRSGGDGSFEHHQTRSASYSAPADEPTADDAAEDAAEDVAEDVVEAGDGG